MLAPQYVSLDLRITVCAQPTAFAADVEAAVLARCARAARRRTRGFFDHDSWTFGEPLESSALLAAVQRATGVRGVTRSPTASAASSPTGPPLPDTVTIPPDQILRVDNDPSRPEAGSLRVIVEGGK